ncbi:PCC domain-containing protein [Collimonas sp.]|uniref:PCC domain-containing protein n=1 Tax=Collimonas sp. TaxID=1963772 RepID=UPI0037C082BF
MQTLPLRLTRGQDLRAALESVLTAHHVTAAFVLQGIGSAAALCRRHAGASLTWEIAFRRRCAKIMPIRANRPA